MRERTKLKKKNYCLKLISSSSILTSEACSSERVLAALVKIPNTWKFWANDHNCNLKPLWFLEIFLKLITSLKSIYLTIIKKGRKTRLDQNNRRKTINTRKSPNCSLSGLCDRALKNKNHLECNVRILYTMESLPINLQNCMYIFPLLYFRTYRSLTQISTERKMCCSYKKVLYKKGVGLLRTPFV